MSAREIQDGIDAMDAYFRNDGTYELIISSIHERKARENALIAETKAKDIAARVARFARVAKQ
jgi:hypothetical protein